MGDQKVMSKEDCSKQEWFQLVFNTKGEGLKEGVNRKQIQNTEQGSRRYGCWIGKKEIRVILYVNKFVGGRFGEFTHGYFYFLGKVGRRVPY